MIRRAPTGTLVSASKPRASGDEPVSGRELAPADGNAFSAGDLVNPARAGE